MHRKVEEGGFMGVLCLTVALGHPSRLIPPSLSYTIVIVGLQAFVFLKLFETIARGAACTTFQPSVYLFCSYKWGLRRTWDGAGSFVPAQAHRWDAAGYIIAGYLPQCFSADQPAHHWLIFPPSVSPIFLTPLRRGKLFFCPHNRKAHT